MGRDADVDRLDAVALAGLVLAGHIVGTGRVVAHQDGTEPYPPPGRPQPGHPLGHVGQHGLGHRRTGHDDRWHHAPTVSAWTGQCLNWRSPVKTIAMPCSSAAAITSASRTDPPGWATAVMPAAAMVSKPSRKGKKASLAPAPPRALPAALATASSPGETRFCWPAPMPTAMPLAARTIALDLTAAHTRQASCRSRQAAELGARLVTTCQPAGCASSR